MQEKSWRLQVFETKDPEVPFGVLDLRRSDFVFLINFELSPCSPFSR